MVSLTGGAIVKLYCVLSGLLLALYFKNLKILFVEVNPWVFYMFYSVAMMPRGLFIKFSDYKVGLENYLIMAFLVALCYLTSTLEAYALKETTASEYTAIRYGVLIFALSLGDMSFKSSVGSLLIIIGIIVR